MDECWSFSTSCEDSLTAQVQVGPIRAELDGGIAVTLPCGVEMTATKDASGALNTTNSGNQIMITIELDGQDVNGYGDEDLLFHFKTQELALNQDSIEAILTGMTTDGSYIIATDSVNIVPKGKDGKKWWEKIKSRKWSV